MSVPFQPSVRAASDISKTRVLSGYASVFYDASNQANTQYRLAPGVLERIRPGAFDRALKEKQDVKALYNHDDQFLLGRTSSGTCRLSVDKIGLRYEVDLPRTPSPPSLIELLERDDLVSSSFCFRVTGVTWQEEGRTSIRWIEDCDLVDVSPVNTPAYTGSTASIRSGTIKDLRFRRKGSLSPGQRIAQIDDESVNDRLAQIDAEELARQRADVARSMKKFNF